MNNINVISINVTGPVQTGKSAICASIKDLLETYGYCVAIPSKSERNNPSEPLGACALHEMPVQDQTVIILTEEVWTK